jgi:hypothetical protein
MQNIGLDGESNCMELLAVLSMLLPTGLICDLCTGTGSQAQSTGREKWAGSKAISHKVLAMSAVPVVLPLCMELTK